MAKWDRKLIDTKRGQFELFIQGHGKPMCITHNYSEFNSSGDHFANMFSETHQVILVNLREAGDSDKAIEPYELSMIEAVFDLEAIREALGFSQWIYAGHSTGGMIGVIYGIHYSASIEKLILVSAAAKEYASSSPDCIYNREHPDYQIMQELIERLKDPTLTANERTRLSVERTKLSLHKPAMYGSYFSASVHKKMSRARMDFFARELMIFGVTHQLENISVPTLIICGRYDVQCPLPFSIEIATAVPDATFHIFEESNHYPFLEEKEKFKQVIDQFIIENGK